MTLKRDPSQLLQVGFLALLAIAVVMVSYWIYDQVQYTRGFEQRIAAVYRAEADALNALYANAAPGEVSTRLPQLVIENRSARVRAEALAALAEERSSRVNRYLWEGAFFFAVLLAGMTILTRAIRHDAELRRRQQNFLAAVSHEFKSPLASIRLAAETLGLRSRDPDAGRLGRRIIDDGDRLLGMIDNLLDATRLEEGRHRTAAEPLAVAATIDAAINAIAERAKHAEVEITRAAPDDLTLTVDRAALETALRNLLDNALKACIAGKGRTIAVQAEKHGNGVQLAVRDDGIGFPPEEAAMIFEKFYRIGDELRRSMPGTGLGLYIVKRLVELTGGHIEAVSDGPGRGATVTIRWPGGAAVTKPKAVP